MNKITSSHQLFQLIKFETYDWHYFWLYLEWFGFWKCEEDIARKEKRNKKSAYYVSEITITSFGEKIIPILLYLRNPQGWNIAYRNENGEINAIPGSPLNDVVSFSLSEMEQLCKELEQDQSMQCFFEPFNALELSGEIKKTLPRNRRKFVDGVYTFKVMLTKKIWRTVTLSAIHTMEDLHLIIMQAFNFDNDHLYSFFMDGKKWSNSSIASPDDDFGHPNASEVKIGDIGLIVKQHFYIYLIMAMNGRLTWK